jgi:ElaB/YqjD/DUF883 family membrane-anchored ribosome-binding protein
MAETEKPTDFDVLQADLRRLRDDVAALTRTLAKATAARVGVEPGAMREAGEQVTEAVNKLAEEARRAGVGGLEALEQKIVERPVTAVLMALGLGLLLGRLGDRR